VTRKKRPESRKEITTTTGGNRDMPTLVMTLKKTAETKKKEGGAVKKNVKIKGSPASTQRKLGHLFE